MNEEKVMCDYDEIYRLFKEGKINEETWNRYCASILELLMINNRDVLMRLKYR